MYKKMLIGGMVKIVMIQFGSAYWDNKLIFSSPLNLKKVFSLIGFGISFHSFTPW